MWKANRRFKVFASLILAASVIGMSACTAKSSPTTSTGESAASAATQAGQTTIYGKVTAMSGSSISLALGTINTPGGMGMPPSNGSGAGAGNRTGTGRQAAGTPSAMPTVGDQSSVSDGYGAQSGSRPAGMGGDLLTLSGKSIDITVTDSTSYSNLTMAFPGNDTATVTPAAVTLSDISVGTVLQVTYVNATSEAVTINIVTGMGGGYAADGSVPGGNAPGDSSSVDTGTGAYVVSDGETLNGTTTYTSTNADENAIRSEGTTTATLDGVTVEKTAGSASSSDSSSFYGMNSAILALGKSTLNITGGTVTATAEGANGVFAYDGATINIAGTAINVSGGNAGGIEVAGGGTLNATDLTVHSTVKAAIRSDRGGGTLTVNGGTYTTSGSTGAPAIYSTANITASDATLTANNSEAIVVEGLNSVTLNNCDATGNMNGTYGDTTSENVHNVMLYQSMSGDAETGTSSFTMTGGTLVSKNGDMFYVTNTDCVISLSDVALTLADGTNLLTVSGNDGVKGWGTAGANGGICAFILSKQTVAGNIAVDAISKLAMTISDSSSFTGSINSDKTTAASLSVTLDAASTWTLTADSYITSFKGSMDNVVTNGHTLYVNGAAMN